MTTPHNRSGSLLVVAVAIVGLLSTIGASALGGYWANESVQRQFQSQRSAAIQDQRRAVYVDLMRATTPVCDAKENKDAAKYQSAAVELLNQQGRALLIATPSLRKPLTGFVKYVLRVKGCDNAKYSALRDAFIDAAQKELGQ
jgi:type II secretory pathway pseudopilin PulG